MDNSNEKTFIGVLASHDSKEKNNDLAKLFNDLYEDKKNREKIKNFHFIFTGGTYDRIISGTHPNIKRDGITPVNPKTKNFLLERSTRLPSAREGGVTFLSYLVTKQQCSIIWPFLTPLTSHWLNPENLALMRLCDLWRVKRLMNSGSIMEWVERESDRDKDRNCQKIPAILTIGTGDDRPIRLDRLQERIIEVRNPKKFPIDIGERTIALISHDEMKTRMVEFSIEYERELGKFERILATGTTGREVLANTRKLEGKVVRYHSGPKGGDIEIAVEILLGYCHVVVFFIDPLNPHPHIEDIRVVFGACMIQDQVRMLTNEMQARHWMDRVMRRKNR